MTITNGQLNELALKIVQCLKEEFEIQHLSKNLINTVQIVNELDEVKVIIPAQTYNMLLYQTEGVVVHTSHGSYASKLDKEGSSFIVYPNGTKKGSHRVNPRNHKNYVDNIIKKAINEFMSEQKLKEVERKDSGNGK